jgi:integrase
MQAQSSHDPRRRERVAENLYRRVTTRGEVVFEVVFRDADGVQRRRTLQARNERAAVKEARAILARRDGGDRVVGASGTLDDFLEVEFVPHIESLAAAGRRSLAGVELDRTLLRLYIRPQLGHKQFRKIDARDIAGLLRTMRRPRKRIPKGPALPLSESTIHSTLAVLRAIYRLAIARGLVTHSPLEALDSSELPRRRPGTSRRRLLDEQELGRLVRAAPELYRTAIAIMVYTGCRISEALALRWVDVDLVDGELWFRGQLTRATSKRPARIVPRKGHADAYAATLLPALSDELTARLEVEVARGRGNTDELVVCTRYGRPLSQRNVARAIAAAAAAAGLEPVSPHDLRRSFCSLAASWNIDPVTAADLTGHSLDTWIRHYARPVSRAAQRRAAVEKLVEHGLGASYAATALPPDDPRSQVENERPADAGF